MADNDLRSLADKLEDQAEAVVRMYLGGDLGSVELVAMADQMQRVAASFRETQDRRERLASVDPYFASDTVRRPTGRFKL